MIRYSICKSGSIFSFEGTSLDRKARKCYPKQKEKHDEGHALAGVNDGEVPPVPIPNTEVKLTCAEDSWLETACENR